MKAAGLIAQSEILVAVASRHPSAKRDDKGLDGFETTLERKKAEGDQDLKSQLAGMPEQPQVCSQDASTDEPRRTAPRSTRSDARLLHHLKEIASQRGADLSADAPGDASPREDTPAVQTAHVEQPATRDADISALAAQLLGRPASDGFGSSELQEKPAPESPVRSGGKIDDAEAATRSAASQVTGMAAALLGVPPARDAGACDFRTELKSGPRSQSSRAIEPHIAGSLVDAEGAVAEAIADTPVVVREQQTHFSREPAGRPSFLPRGETLEQSLAVKDRPQNDGPSAPRAAQPRVAAANGDAPQVGVRGNGDAGTLADDASDPPTPAMQVLGKILDAFEEKGASPSTPASSAQWHPTERPFGALLRVIRLELSPASLGVVHVTLKGANAALSISIEAERPQTAASLGADRAALSSRLHDSGYAIDDLVVTTLDRPLDIAAPPRTDQTAGASSSQLAMGTDDMPRRQADDGSRRHQPEPDRHPQGEARGKAPDGANTGAELPRAPAMAWRGRHTTRSV